MLFLPLTVKFVTKALFRAIQRQESAKHYLAPGVQIPTVQHSLNWKANC